MSHEVDRRCVQYRLFFIAGLLGGYENVFANPTCCVLCMRVIGTIEQAMRVASHSFPQVRTP